MIIRFSLLFLLIAFSHRLSAQLCQGSLGDPVVKIDFGSGPNPGPTLSFPTGYGFVTNDCPNDGFYAVRNSTSSCFGDSWHSLVQDHTGNGSGYFMLVNASLQKGDFYVDTVRGLCPKTTFEFAAWVVNVLKPSACNAAGITPDLTFYIQNLQGDTLQKYNTGSIPSQNSPQWKQYGFFFETPAGLTDVIVRIRNNADGGCGNDLALDDITFRPCGPEVKASIQGESVIDVKDLCDYNSKSYTLTGAITQGYTDPAYQWQLSTNNVNWSDIGGATAATYTRTPTPTGTYYYRMAVAEKENISSALCRIYSNVIKFNVESKPVTTAGSNSPVCEDAALSLTATGGISYSWKGPGNFSSSVAQPVIQPTPFGAAGKYYVTVTSAAGCVQTDSTVVSVVAKPAANAGSDAGICAGRSTTLNGVFANGTVAWSPSTGLSATNIANPTVTPADSTTYTLTVTDNNTGCTAQDSVRIFVYDLPVANAGPDKVIMEGNSIALEGAATGTGITFNWAPNTSISDPVSLTPLVTPPADATYTLNVYSELGCGIASDNVFIKVYKKVVVPNAFSPNNDGINDKWQILALDAYPDAVVSVFNRYGKAVFTSKGSYTAWNGKFNNTDLPVGTYYYVIDLKSAGELKLAPLKGSLTILR
ncbi:gliding motility-associated C-terminal domain-containing protein [Panacibacter sp. DH6]|uniref:Gliding motility-associated C-terminal domain-containing protein n=1 Tax=Panacibacter microcysteis TaxID=2793269 RepID=A0A931GZ54_9BACT|nr:gliding motility-associated C-terminal domain-containing protein [Panacibacter microcysteis]MBG9378041.1 gliding motility-associated C-terminal domain-containing protein [Panacibacter microcysteis]